MRLWQSRFSPFARKVLVLAHELGIADRIVAHDTDPHTDEGLRRVNPLCKVPTLVLADGRAVYDSRVICDYLLALGEASRVAGPRDRDSWEIARDHALGDGICDAAVALRGEKLRLPGEQSAHYMDRQRAAILAGCDVLAADVDRLRDRVDIGAIAIACALGYLDLRHPEIDWRRGRGALAQWFVQFAARDSMRATAIAAP
ncbi:MAG: glutathione S-transferase N-terminal domain-containing protein [Burkholderiales bacterium]